jgi:hypothetical protein
MTPKQREAMRMPTNVRTAMEGLGADPKIYEDAIDKALAEGATESAARMAAMNAMVNALPKEHAIGMLGALSKELGIPAISLKLSGSTSDMLTSLLGKRDHAPASSSDEFAPASAEQASLLTNASYQPSVGDVVKWRDGMRNLTMPAYGQEFIVSDVFEARRTPNGRYDMATAIYRPCDADECAGGHLEELLVDSRRVDFVRRATPSKKAERQRTPFTP